MNILSVNAFVTYLKKNENVFIICNILIFLHIFKILYEIMHSLKITLFSFHKAFLRLLETINIIAIF